MKSYTTPMKLKYIIIFFTSFLLGTSFSQVALGKDKVKWKFIVEQKDCEATIIAEATIENHWHINAIKLPKEVSSYATAFNFSKSKEYSLVGDVQEPKAIFKHDDLIDEDLYYHEGKIKFRQKIKINGQNDFKIKGTVDFQTCNESECLPPYLNSFDINIKGCKDDSGAISDTSTSSLTSQGNDQNENIEENKGSKASSELKKESPKKSTQSLWAILLISFAAGFTALIMPCVFPMIPMTVSFFTKRSKTRAMGIRNAFIYGASIITIHLLLGGLVIVTGAKDLLNSLSTDPYFNLFFFAMLLIFGLSFLGAFEIQLPAKWVNKADEKADKGGIVGIFFMALVLSLASFSCTGPILGSLLGELSRTSGSSELMTGMFGFGFALALPFMLFALFPSWLNSMPSSGGWLNVVKVFLGFLEIAFAFKFLSSADTTLQWHLLEREVFIAIWIAVFGALTLYLFGKIRLPHDSAVDKLSVGRTMMATMTLAFTLYLIPGMWGAPLKIVNAFLPPDFYAESPNGFGGTNGGSNADTSIGEHSSDMHLGPKGIQVFHDYDKALEYSQKVNKPLFVDFTGWGCTNCRKLEQSVWGESGILEHLKNDVVVVSLYVDERTELPKNEQKSIKLGDEPYQLRTIGNKWTAFQINKYKISSQPYYVIQNSKGEDMPVGPATYATHKDPKIFQAWLEKGIENAGK
jgi:thiol:disulfide interchange protein